MNIPTYTMQTINSFQSIDISDVQYAAGIPHQGVSSKYQQQWEHMP
jgi:hypothetical protein